MREPSYLKGHTTYHVRMMSHVPNTISAYWPAKLTATELFRAQEFPEQYFFINIPIELITTVERHQYILAYNLIRE